MQLIETNTLFGQVFVPGSKDFQEFKGQDPAGGDLLSVSTPSCCPSTYPPIQLEMTRFDLV